MPQTMDKSGDDDGLTRNDLERLEGYVARARHGTPARRAEIKAIAQLKRTLRRAQEADAALDAPSPGTTGNGAQPALPDIYGNHRLIPLDWRPSPQTLEWTVATLQSQNIAFDMDWLIAEFVTFWRSRAKAMANWQQAFRNNVLQKLGRGINLAPTHQTGPGRPQTVYRRIYDRPAELSRQRLADFDDEAAGIARRAEPVRARSGKPGRAPDGPVDPDD